MPTPCSSPCCCVLFRLRGLLIIRCQKVRPLLWRRNAFNRTTGCSKCCWRVFFWSLPSICLLLLLPLPKKVVHCARPAAAWCPAFVSSSVWLRVSRPLRKTSSSNGGPWDQRICKAMIPCSTIPSPNISIFIHHVHLFIVLFANFCLSIIWITSNTNHMTVSRRAVQESSTSFNSFPAKKS